MSLSCLWWMFIWGFGVVGLVHVFGLVRVFGLVHVFVYFSAMIVSVLFDHLNVCIKYTLYCLHFYTLTPFKGEGRYKLYYLGATCHGKSNKK